MMWIEDFLRMFKPKTTQHGSGHTLGAVVVVGTVVSFNVCLLI